MAKKDFTNDFDALLATAQTAFSEPQQEQQQRPTQGGTTHYTAKDGTTYTKRNFMFNDATWEKLQALQRQTGMKQHELLNEIVQYYVNQYEQKFGEITTTKKLL